MICLMSFFFLEESLSKRVELSFIRIKMKQNTLTKMLSSDTFQTIRINISVWDKYFFKSTFYRSFIPNTGLIRFLRKVKVLPLSKEKHQLIRKEKNQLLK